MCLCIEQGGITIAGISWHLCINRTLMHISHTPVANVARRSSNTRAHTGRRQAGRLVCSSDAASRNMA
jgi:hypothetical protein